MSIHQTHNRSLLWLALAPLLACTADSTATTEEPACTGKCDATDDLGEDQDFTRQPGVAECADAIESIPAEALHAEGRLDEAHATAISDAGRICLTHYLRLNTTNPRKEGEGVGETAAAHFFAGLAQRLDLPFRFATLAGNPDLDRLSIVATLAGKQRDDSILLLGHSDVVHADGEWTHAPFAGFDDGEFIWGRGAIDMKATSISQLITLAILAKSGVELQRDIHLVVTGDEEVTGAGGEFIALTDRDDSGEPIALDPLDLRPGVVLNEGGTGIEDAVLPGRDVFLLGTEEKGLVWTQLASPSPAPVLQALVRSAIVDPVPAAAIPDASARAALGERCRVTKFISDEAQKTNVQARVSTVRLECGEGMLASVQSAIDVVVDAIEPKPRIDVTDDGGEIEIAIEMGVGGHGSMSSGATALTVGLASLVATGQIDPSALVNDEDARERFFGFALSEANEELIATLARVVGPVTGSLVGWLAEREWLVTKSGEQVSPLLPSEVPFRNTCSWTAFDFPADGEARAKLDCRLIHQFGAADFERQLVDFMAENDEVVLRNGMEHCFDCTRQEFNRSPMDSSASDYQILKAITQRASAHAVVAPYLFPASSDSYFFRLAGVPTYGFSAATLREELLKTFHAIDERFPVAQMFQQQKIYAEIVYAMANRIAPAPADDAHALDDAMRCFERDDDFIGDDEWEATDEIECSVQARSYYCEMGDDAPRYLRMRAEDQDVRLLRVEQLTADFTDAEPIPEPDGPFIARSLFEQRDEETPLKHRIFEGHEMEIDTGTESRRLLHVRCQLPVTVNVVDDAELKFYRD